MRAHRVLTVALALALLAAACGNSKSGTSSTTTAKSGPTTPETTASSADLTKNLPRPGVNGVTDSQIGVTVITAKTNPLGGKYHEYIDGVNAYFKMINDAGGIYGRKLVVLKDRDDNTGLLNTQMTTAAIADDKPFAVFEATQMLAGADLLAKAGIPTFIWNIDAEFASTPRSDHSNIFGSYPALCFTCAGPYLPWLAIQNGFTKAGIIGYGVNAASKGCAVAQRDSYNKFGNGKVTVAFFDNTLPFAADVAADVAKMKQAGVQLISTCVDTNEALKIAKEVKKQGLNAVQDMPNAYDHDFVKQNADVLEGSFLQPQYVAKENQPQSPATQQYYDKIQAITSDPVELTEFGWIMAQMFVDGLKGAGPEFTQQKVIDFLNSQTAYNSGGLVPDINWTTGHINPVTHPEVRAAMTCVIAMQIKNGAFVPFKEEPGKPWTCLDNSQSAEQTSTHRSFAPGGTG
jgi:ABC-type branched-subunit amino acid transport system substrate-binding protein